MAIPFSEFLSQATSGDYRHGLGKKCCASCAQGGPCTGCGAPAGARCGCCDSCGQPPGRCRCAMSGYIRQDDYARFLSMQAKGQQWQPPSAGQLNTAFSGLGGLGATVIQGQADLEPGDWGYQYKQTTKPGTTVTGRVQGRPPVARRQQITRMISELEFLAGTPGVHERVLAQKVWQARKALMGTSKWSWANYQDPSVPYDSYDDLVARLEAVERVLGVEGVSPKIMSQLYGMGGLGSYGYDGSYSGAPWGAAQSPVEKLASCIRGALCAPKAFCCPPGSMYEDPYYDDFPEFEDFPEPDFFSAGGNGNGTWIGGDPDTWIGGDPDTWIGGDPDTWIGGDPPWTRLPPPGGEPPKEPDIKIGWDFPKTTTRPRTGDGTKKPDVKIGQDVTVRPRTTTKPKPTDTTPKQTGPAVSVTPKLQDLIKAPMPPVTGAGTPQQTGVPISTARYPMGPQGNLQARGYRTPTPTSGAVRSAAPLGPSPQMTVGVHGLGARRSPALSTLVAQIRVARRQARRGSR